MAIVKNALAAMERRLEPEQVHHSRLVAERKILAIRLAELRERRGIKQTELKTFSQTAASKFERRKDMKISTLIEYLEDMAWVWKSKSTKSQMKPVAKPKPCYEFDDAE